MKDQGVAVFGQMLELLFGQTVQFILMQLQMRISMLEASAIVEAPSDVLSSRTAPAEGPSRALSFAQYATIVLRECTSMLQGVADSDSQAGDYAAAAQEWLRSDPLGSLSPSLLHCLLDTPQPCSEVLHALVDFVRTIEALVKPDGKTMSVLAAPCPQRSDLRCTGPLVFHQRSMHGSNQQRLRRHRDPH